MTQWLFNFVIAKVTPIMLARITYGTFLLFGACCICMAFYAVCCVPETKNVPLESIQLLFEGNIIKGCLRDTVPRHSRAKTLQNHHRTGDDVLSVDGVGKGCDVEHIEARAAKQLSSVA